MASSYSSSFSNGSWKEEESYYGMAKYFCGKEIADKSWLVRLDFPKASGASVGQGQIFLAKSKEEGWFALTVKIV